MKHANSLEDVERAADVLWQKVPVLVIKRGSQGALVRTAKEKLMNFPPVVNVADHVGAGDNFDAGFVHQYIRGTSIEDCLKFANIVGSLSVTRPGGTEAFRDAQHRESFLRSHPVGGNTRRLTHDPLVVLPRPATVADPLPEAGCPQTRPSISRLDP